MSAPPENPRESLSFPPRELPNPPAPLQGLKRTLSSKTDDPHPPHKPPLKRPVTKAEIPPIDKVTSGDGEIFLIGDTVWVTESGGKTRGIIETFYADASGEIWAQIAPPASDKLCFWQRACIRGKFLVREL